MNGFIHGLGGRLLRLHDAGVRLAESVCSSDDTGTFTQYNLRFVMHGGATKSPARNRILLDPQYAWFNAARRRGDIDLCAGVRDQERFVSKRPPPTSPRGTSAQRFRKMCIRKGRTALFTNPRAVISPCASPPSLKPRRLRPAAASAPIVRDLEFERLPRLGNLRAQAAPG